jgi:PAS domain S-box-containing protein
MTTRKTNMSGKRERRVPAPKKSEAKLKQMSLALEKEITLRKLAMETLRESEEKFRTIFNSASDAVFIRGFEGSFIEVNDTACTRLGYSREELLKMSPLDIDTEEFAARVPERTQLIKDSGLVSFETIQVSKNGDTIPTEINSRIIEYKGNPVILSIARNITERKRHEVRIEELNRALSEVNEDLKRKVQEQAQTLKEAKTQLLQTAKLATLGEMAGGPAHELDEPLSGISLISKQLSKLSERGELSGEELKPCIKDIDRLIVRMSGIINHIRTFAGKDTLKFVEVGGSGNQLRNYPQSQGPTRCGT